VVVTAGETGPPVRHTAAFTALWQFVGRQPAALHISDDCAVFFIEWRPELFVAPRASAGGARFIETEEWITARQRTNRTAYHSSTYTSVVVSVVCVSDCGGGFSGGFDESGGDTGDM